MIQEIEILLVEDDSSDAALTVHELKRHRLANNLRVAEDGAEALDIIFCRGESADRRFDHPPKVILLDLKLPKVDGLEVLKAVRNDERTKAIPIVIMTSSREQRDIVESYKLGVNAYIQKPVDFEEFRSTVERLGMFWLVVNAPPPPQAFGGR